MSHKRESLCRIKSAQAFLLFSLIISLLFLVTLCIWLEKIIHVCFQGVDHPSFFFEPRTFIIEPLLLFKKSLLFRLQRLQARQFFIALHGKQCTPRRLKDHKLGFVLCLEARLVFRLLEGVIHSKDLSVKTTSAKVQMMKQGKYVGGYAPYGYVLHPTIRNKLAVDPEAADVIRRIFCEALDGSNTSQIARSLNDDGIPTPGQYFKSKHPDKKKFHNMSEKISWETVMVYKILKNPVYTGTLVSHKMKSCGVGSRRQVPNEPIIVEGTHEAIVSKEDFELAQKVIRGGGRNPTRKQHDYPLKGLVRCGNCKRVMTRRKNQAGIRFYQCTHSVNNGNTDCPVGRSFPEMDIEKVVFHALTQFLALAQKEAVQNHEVGDLRKAAIKECADKIRSLQKQNEQHKASKLRLYEKYAAGSITKEAYIQQKAATDAKIAENDEAIQRSHERMKELDSETSCSDEKLDAVCDQYADCKALTYELTHAFISAVYIYDLDNIEIVWKFKDFLTTSEGESK